MFVLRLLFRSLQMRIGSQLTRWQYLLWSAGGGAADLRPSPSPPPHPPTLPTPQPSPSGLESAAEKQKRPEGLLEFFRPPASWRLRSSAPCGTQQLTEAAAVFGLCASLLCSGGFFPSPRPRKTRKLKRRQSFQEFLFCPPGGGVLFCRRAVPLLLVKH